jgi:hypothetical protein
MEVLIKHDGRCLVNAHMSSVYPRGSAWRRWDLHVHTPDSFENSFGGWDGYVQALEAVNAVSVLGVTDYFFIDGYRKLLDLRSQGKLTNFDLLLPNIELRLGTFVPKRSDGTQLRRLNFHVIFSDQLSPDVIQDQFISDLHFQIDGHPEDSRGKRNVTKTAIEEAGRLVKAVQPAFAKDSDFVAGCKVITFDVNEAVTALQKGCFEGKYLLFLAAENWDQISWDGQDYLVRKNLLQTSHGLFCGQANTIAWCLGRLGDMTADRFIREFGALKPCLHGSDAHTNGKIGKPDEDKFCWIKADPTFEGLKQIVYEPNSRVYIGPTPPVYHDEARILRSVTLANSNGWFDDGEIPLNPGLVSIIGQKGSGKSALAEIIAYAAGSWNASEQGSFLRRAGTCVQDLTVRLTWADGSVTNQRIGSPPSADQKVRYLSQRFVERLCADDHIGKELVREIENVIFAYTDPTETLNASNFEELRALRTQGIREDRDELRGGIVRLIREECALRDNKAKVKDKKARIKALQEEEVGLKKQLPAPATEAEKKLQVDLQNRREALMQLQQEVASYKQKLQKISDVKTRVASFKNQMAGFYAEIETYLIDIGVLEGDREALKPKFSGDPETALSNADSALRKKVGEKEGATENPAEGTIRALELQIKALTDKDTADKARQKRIKDIQTRIAAIGIELGRLNVEIAQIEGPEKERLEQVTKERLLCYGGYFKNLQEEQKALEALYTPVKKRLLSPDASVTEQDLEFSIRWDVDVDKWLQRGAALFDQRRSNPFGDMEGMAKAARDSLVPAWMSGNSETIMTAFHAFREQFRSKHPREFVRTDVTIQDVSEWLYEVDHIHLNYGLKYNKVDLEKLSPGTKGIVLLILYLGMDTADTRPLIVDQPDENLDNESIYDLLRAYFQLAKTRRQVILISHNPNLVVNADSDQVIVATNSRRDNGFPHITYQMGSLENGTPEQPGIRQRACRILEGGDVAFQTREHRYAIGKRVFNSNSQTD